MWKVKSLKLYRQNGVFLAFIKASKNGITKVRSKLYFILCFNFIKVFRKTYENMESMPMPNQEITIEQLEEPVDAIITL